jgi:hypothetical protein
VCYNPILIAIFRQDASPADSVPNGITIKVSTVETSTPNKDNAKEWIKSTLTKRKKDVKDVKDVVAQKTSQDGSKTTTKSEKIDTNGIILIVG